MKQLSSYLSAGMAAAATLQSGDAATIITLYGPGARSPGTSPATPTGINFGFFKTGQAVDYEGKKGSYFAFSGSAYFTAGTNLSITSAGPSGNYTYKSVFINGAQSGSANYANIDFDGNSVYEAVGQFSFDAVGGGYLVALAINDDASALSISAGKAAIDAVPEPSAIALFALGAGGLVMRRRRKVA